MYRIFNTVGLLSTLLLSERAVAAISEAQFAQLQAQLRTLTARIQALEEDNAHLRSLLDPAEAAVANATGRRSNDTVSRSLSWEERISLSGDFRYRYEAIDVQGADTRERHRIRARARILATLPGRVQVGTEFSTGGDNPLSANQTLGQGGVRKDLGLSQAYMLWRPLDEAYLTAGKIRNPFYRPAETGLLWDDDYNPEGIAAGWSDDRWFAAVLGSWLESDSALENEQLTWGAQAGVHAALGATRLTAGVGYFDIPVAGHESFYGGDGVFFGNTFECTDPDALEGCFYRHDYEELELFAALDFDVFSLPATLYLDTVQNLAVDDDDQGWLAGLQIGRASAPRTWSIGYQYEELDADAAFGLVTDSNFAAGGTDGRGHKLYGMYAFRKGVKLGLTWFINNRFGDDGLSRPLTYDRVIIDARFKY